MAATHELECAPLVLMRVHLSRGFGRRGQALAPPCWAGAPPQLGIQNITTPPQLTTSAQHHFTSPPPHLTTSARHSKHQVHDWHMSAFLCVQNPVRPSSSAGTCQWWPGRWLSSGPWPYTTTTYYHVLPRAHSAGLSPAALVRAVSAFERAARQAARQEHAGFRLGAPAAEPTAGQVRGAGACVACEGVWVWRGVCVARWAPNRGRPA